MEVCNLMVEKAPFGVCNDCYTSEVFGKIPNAVLSWDIIKSLISYICIPTPGLFVCAFGTNTLRYL